ncbi:hypothetical protein NDU88_001992 [Pleurodeles waltl]|uniref:Uncharacterized protein n=1 Tax=Pleurodeles waltl TaxID=8319 RepID=A0AAV7PCU1_PLEWA|nr:hypothetical protein NDU88_001992 [Pleurodeles waltl]
MRRAFQVTHYTGCGRRLTCACLSRETSSDPIRFKSAEVNKECLRMYYRATARRNIIPPQSIRAITRNSSLNV